MSFSEKYKKEDLERLIFDENKSYREIGRIYGVSDTYIKKVANKFGIILKKRKEFPFDYVPHNRGTAKNIECKFCSSVVIRYNNKQIFCSHKCGVDYKIEEKLNHYLNNQKEYCFDRDMQFFKKHILSDQKNCCDVCKNKDEWNDKKIVFVLDHIDGDAANNMRDNLRLVCPNCDSQLDTYKSKNKNSARKERYIKNYKE